MLLVGREGKFYYRKKRKEFSLGVQGDREKKVRKGPRGEEKIHPLKFLDFGSSPQGVSTEKNLGVEDRGTKGKNLV